MAKAATGRGGWWGGPKDSRGIPSADSQDGTPNGFHVLAVDGSAYTTRFVPAAGKAPAQLRAIVDGPHRPKGVSSALTLADLPGCELVVNVFDGGPATRVSYATIYCRTFMMPAEDFSDITDAMIAPHGERFAKLVWRDKWQGYGKEGPRQELLALSGPSTQSPFG